MALQEHLPAKAPLCPSILPATGTAGHLHHAIAPRRAAVSYPLLGCVVFCRTGGVLETFPAFTGHCLPFPPPVRGREVPKQ